MTNATRWIGLGLLLASGGVVVVVTLDAPTAARLPMVLFFILVVPGWAMLRAVELERLGPGMVLTMSLVWGVALSETMIYMARWDVDGALFVTVGFVLFLEAISALRDLRRATAMREST
jgi:hypothetical protein